jgi:lipopolysaccharide/colanic/teichoic acid biosynthesis glycosyltransferase
MTNTLPTLSLRRTKDLLVLNTDNCTSEFVASLTQYQIGAYDGVFAYRQLVKLQTVSKQSEVPYAIICDYATLAKDNFAFVRAFRKNIFTALMPIIAIATENDCYIQPVDSRDICERIEFLHKNKSLMSELNIHEKETLEVRLSPTKRVVDVCIAVVCILMASPILLLTAVLIRLESKGSVIYRSKRSGTGYKIFDFLKFRSMYADSDSRLAEIQHLNQYDDTFMKVKNDPRITKVGRFIRKTSIDELPQLFNVLRGDMSIVGNRPLPLYEAEQLTKEDWTYRFMAPAGITGLWQVTKRGKDDMSAEERIGLDVTYAKKNSFWFDLKIMLKTPFSIIQKENV